MKFTYQRQYIENDPSLQKWEIVSLKVVRERLGDWYKDVTPIIDAMKQGQTFRTPFAYYRAVKK